jgi:hypothetical protein
MRTLPGWVAVWISLSLRIDTWVRGDKQGERSATIRMRER